MPANMHSFYLRSCYLGNQLARGEMEIEGVRLRLSDVKQDMFVVGAENDHIAPWTSAYKTTQLVAGDLRFVLSSAGHIAGIVNPPNKKARYYTNDRYPAEPREWREAAVQHQGSWWDPWVDWMAQRAGGQIDPPTMGNDRFRPLGTAPGTYVRDK
jgi:polyhydroxyalkanoate synthase